MQKENGVNAMVEAEIVIITGCLFVIAGCMILLYRRYNQQAKSIELLSSALMKINNNLKKEEKEVDNDNTNQVEQLEQL